MTVLVDLFWTCGVQGGHRAGVRWKCWLPLDHGAQSQPDASVEGVL